MFARGRLAWCLGQEEHGRRDLITLLGRAPGSPTDLEVRRALAARGVFVGADGAPLPLAAERRWTSLTKPHVEIWVQGGAALGGVDTHTTLYEGLELQELEDGLIWWAITPEFSSGWQETNHAAGAAPKVTAGFTIYAPQAPPTWVPQLGIGLALGLARSTATVDGWRAEAELFCEERRPDDSCVSSRFLGLRMGDADRLMEQAVHRFTLAPEIVLRARPDRALVPAIHILPLRLDLPVGRPGVWCSEPEREVFGSNFPAWYDTTLSDWHDRTPDVGSQVTLGGSSWEMQTEQQECGEQIGGLEAVRLDFSLGGSLTAQATPALSFRARLDVSPEDPIRIGTDAFPTGGVHDEAEARIRAVQPEHVLIRVDLSLGMGVSF